MTEDDIKAIEARAKAATEGPWTFEDEQRHAAKVRVGNSVICQVVGDSAETLDTANFIAHARQDIPALIAEVMRLRGRLEFLQLGEELAGSAYQNFKRSEASHD